MSTGLTASYGGGTTAFALAVDSGTAVGNAAQLRVSYDLTGNGSWDRVETYRYFATDPVSGAENYTQRVGLLSSSGTLGNLVEWLGEGRDLDRADRRRGQRAGPPGEFLGDTAVLVGGSFTLVDIRGDSISAPSPVTGYGSQGAGAWLHSVRSSSWGLSVLGGRPME